MGELATTHDAQQLVGGIRDADTAGFPVVDGAFGHPQQFRRIGHGEVGSPSEVPEAGGSHGNGFGGFPGTGLSKLVTAKCC